MSNIRPNIPSGDADSGHILVSHDSPTPRAATAPEPRHPATGAGSTDPVGDGDSRVHGGSDLDRWADANATLAATYGRVFLSVAQR